MYVCALVGAFTNSSGSIVGTPFLIGDLRSLVAPNNATQLQLGVNDDIFSDNRGAFSVKVTSMAASAPEPGALALLLPVGLALASGVARRRRAVVIGITAASRLMPSSASIAR